MDKAGKFLTKFFAGLICLLLVIIIPLNAVFMPLSFIGSLFGSAIGSFKDVFGGTYEGDFSVDLDEFVAEHHISIDYNAMVGCVLKDMKDNPSECLDQVDLNTGLMNIGYGYDYGEYFNVPNEEYIGVFDDSVFNYIHVLGKYTVDKWEKVGSKQEKTGTKLVHICSRSGDKLQTESGCPVGYTDLGIKNVDVYEEVDEYDWVYHPEMKRGKCEDSETQRCYITLDDEDVYPYNEISFSINKRYGIYLNIDTLLTESNNYQIWNGGILSAFSKGVIQEANESRIVLYCDVNGVQLTATYESEDGYLSPEFVVGETVEATEIVGYSEGLTRFSVTNSDGLYINPAVFTHPRSWYRVIGTGTIIYGYEDFAPDFSKTDIWIDRNPYSKDNMGQCTWFCWGLFYQHYGYDPGFRGSGWNAVADAYEVLKDRGWTISDKPAPGAIFSTVGFNHTGMVAGVNTDDTMIIVDGNHNLKNDTYEEAQSDWLMRTTSIDHYRSGHTHLDYRYIFLVPPR